MHAVGMTGFAGRVNSNGIVQVAQIYDHAHGRQPVDFKGVAYVPACGVDDAFLQ